MGPGVKPRGDAKGGENNEAGGMDGRFTPRHDVEGWVPSNHVRHARA